ncbi:hypothetical protein EMIHUDRAFT_247259 [Emiliania huxleyi CCMP1516]|uniref:Uncharacterized protein n=2 Tax=Emiliania huxleyi TaxID=2903 RepID=A0A0D3INE3_EMIH1|nr:hypothetical protein EMIHUDRAFT_247259 [Emiliania huxleyi CCMP1516]EOD12778.1 hypothetical protein EMIHUDRAFT_247259 [Emiliania huxleyi CCMP1516]|eukprot:XP_005765207.1 hypothetical protein EMIHUDRAFT_247259 [Emiliania huxleyi CCMP1516]
MSCSDGSTCCCAAVDTSTGIADCSLVTAVAERAFERCADVTSVTFGANLESIGNSAFSNSGLLGDLDLSSTSLATIAMAAFAQCQGLTSVTFGSSIESIESIGGSAFYDTGLSGTLDLITATSLNTIGNEAFRGTDITSVIFACGANVAIGTDALGPATRVDASSEECYPGIPGGLACPPGHFLGFGKKGGCRTTTCETGQYTALRGITTFDACAERPLTTVAARGLEYADPHSRSCVSSNIAEAFSAFEETMIRHAKDGAGCSITTCTAALGEAAYGGRCSGDRCSIPSAVSPPLPINVGAINGCSGCIDWQHQPVVSYNYQPTSEMVPQLATDACVLGPSRYT